jgi:plastocyanin
MKWGMPKSKGALQVKCRLKLGFLIICVISSGCSVGDPRSLPNTDISLTIENSRFTPRKWFVPSGERIHLSVENPSGDLHNLVILKGEAEGETDPNLVQNQYLSISVQQHAEDFSFQAPAMPGEYHIVCSIDDHETKGEQGILVVVIP